MIYLGLTGVSGAGKVCLDTDLISIRAVVGPSFEKTGSHAAGNQPAVWVVPPKRTVASTGQVGDRCRLGPDVDDGHVVAARATAGEHAPDETARAAAVRVGLLDVSNHLVVTVSALEQQLPAASDTRLGESSVDAAATADSGDVHGFLRYALGSDPNCAASLPKSGAVWDPETRAFACVSEGPSLLSKSDSVVDAQSTSREAGDQPADRSVSPSRRLAWVGRLPSMPSGCEPRSGRDRVVLVHDARDAKLATLGRIRDLGGLERGTIEVLDDAQLLRLLADEDGVQVLELVPEQLLVPHAELVAQPADLDRVQGPHVQQAHLLEVLHPAVEHRDEELVGRAVLLQALDHPDVDGVEETARLVRQTALRGVDDPDLVSEADRLVAVHVAGHSPQDLLEGVPEAARVDPLPLLDLGLGARGSLGLLAVDAIDLGEQPALTVERRRVDDALLRGPAVEVDPVPLLARLVGPRAVVAIDHLAQVDAEARREALLVVRHVAVRRQVLARRVDQLLGHRDVDGVHTDPAEDADGLLGDLDAVAKGAPNVLASLHDHLAVAGHGAPPCVASRAGHGDRNGVDVCCFPCSAPQDWGA